MLVCVGVAIVRREEWCGEGRVTETWEVSWIARMVLDEDCLIKSTHSRGRIDHM